MPLTFADLKTAIDHTLAGQPASGASYGRIINGAGRAWVAAREWYYLAHRTATLTTVAGSELVVLPADYRSLVTVTFDNTSYSNVQFVTPGEFQTIKDAEIGVVATTAYVGCVVWGTDMLPVLKLFPAPSTVETLTLVYDAAWSEVNEDDDVIPVPGFAEHVFEEWVRAYARGLDEEDAGPLAERLAVLKASPMFRDVAQRDALVTGAVLSPGYGAAAPGRRHYVRWNHPGNLA